ncbi:hypothetical protein HPP92_025626 [Vanilla planifolia]|uniref:Gfo/Idh/MocA-like oxidoreductase C-terminal domain-containing protein n=1 Tax=Vanilla planifolia TaxID=51239 RepID=A0A835PMN1_VANPL|nr:hypothetical protein HPP92_025626 [Vanilla planifolia]
MGEGVSGDILVSPLTKFPEMASAVEENPTRNKSMVCILEFDGASKDNSGKTGPGPVLRAEEGSVVSSFYHPAHCGFLISLVQDLWKTKNQNMADLCKEVKGLKDRFLSFDIVHVKRPSYTKAVQVNNWNRFNANTGGTLVEKCCHFFDLMRLFAAANPVRVMASGSIDVNHKDEIYDGKVPDIIDNAYVIVEFDNGSRGMLDLCMFAEGSKNEQEISVVGDIGKGEAFVPEGIVRIGKRSDGRAGVKTFEAKDPRIKYEGLHHGSSYLEHLNFLSSVKAHGSSGAAPFVDLEDGLLSVAMGVAGQRSIEEGCFVTIAEVLSGH